MKTAYEYRRISKEDQSYFSLSGQGVINKEYSDRHNITIVKTFIDDGYSAKDFNRPEWKKLEKELTVKKVDYLIVWKYDRLIREATDGLAFVKHLENDLKIILLSSMETYTIDPEDPNFFSQRATLFVDAEKERRKISDRTKMGIWQARSLGHYVTKAPFGYKNERDQAKIRAKDGLGEPILVVHPEQQNIVKTIFTEFLNNKPFHVIKKEVEEKGFNMKGNEAIKRILSNSLYAGLISVKAYRNQPKKIVKGLHEPIIDEETYWRAYYKLQDQARSHGPKIFDVKLPLRGFLQCECGEMHIGTRCKGRSAYYWYYWCQAHKGKSHNASKVDNDIRIILQGLSMPEKYIKALNKKVAIKLEENEKDRSSNLQRVNREYYEVKKKLDVVSDKYFSQKITDDLYQKWHSTYTHDLSQLQDQINGLKQTTDDLKKLYDDHLPYLSDLNWIYTKIAPEDKQPFLKGIFPSGLTTIESGYRTAFIESPFSANASQISYILVVEKEMGASFSQNSHQGSNPGINSNPLEGFLRLIQHFLKKAA